MVDDGAHVQRENEGNDSDTSEGKDPQLDLKESAIGVDEEIIAVMEKEMSLTDDLGKAVPPKIRRYSGTENQDPQMGDAVEEEVQKKHRSPS